MYHRISITIASALAVTAAPVFLAALSPAAASAATRAVAQVPTSTNYAGWLAGTFKDRRQATKSATTTFIVPAVICNSADANSFVVIGVGLPTGTSTVVASGVAVGCQGTTPFYTGEIDINGTITPVSVPITPGDKITTSLKVTSAATTGFFEDVTKGVKQPIKGHGGQPSGSCIGIDGSENGTGGDPAVPDFGKVVFSAGTINGVSIKASGATQVNMATTTGVLQISTGPLNATGKGFTSKFVSVG